MPPLYYYEHAFALHVQISRFHRSCKNMTSSCLKEMPTASTLGKLNVTVAEEEEEEAAYTQDITMKCHTMNNIYRVNLK